MEYDDKTKHLLNSQSRIGTVLNIVARKKMEDIFVGNRYSIASRYSHVQAKERLRQIDFLQITSDDVTNSPDILMQQEINGILVRNMHETLLDYNKCMLALQNIEDQLIKREREDAASSW